MPQEHLPGAANLSLIPIKAIGGVFLYKNQKTNRVGRITSGARDPYPTATKSDLDNSRHRLTAAPEPRVGKLHPPDNRLLDVRRCDGCSSERAPALPVLAIAEPQPMAAKVAVTAVKTQRRRSTRFDPILRLTEPHTRFRRSPQSRSQPRWQLLSAPIRSGVFLLKASIIRLSRP